MKTHPMCSKIRYQIDSRTQLCYSVRQEVLTNIKFTVRVPKKDLENAKHYAKTHHTTLTELVSTYLKQIPTEVETLDHAPVVRQLTGLLWKNVSSDDYKKHLDEKYANPQAERALNSKNTGKSLT
jgi:hypothetical protein